MKKIIFITAMLVLSASTAFSQRFEWGVKAGLNVSPIKEPVANHYETIHFGGFHVGVLGEYKVSDIFGVQSELLFSTSLCGRKYGKRTAWGWWSYLVLPVMGKWYVTPKWSFDFGPQIGVMLVNDVLSTRNYGRKIDLSFGIGLSYKISRRFDISTRYNWGVIRTARNTDQWNNTFRLSVGYRF